MVVRVGGSTTGCEVCGHCWSCKTEVTSSDTVTGWDTLFKMFTASDGFSLHWSTDTDAMSLHGLVSSKIATQFTRGVAVGLPARMSVCYAKHMNPPDWSVFKTLKCERTVVFKGPAKAGSWQLAAAYVQCKERSSLYIVVLTMTVDRHS